MEYPHNQAMDSEDEFVVLDSPATERHDRVRIMAKQIDTLMAEMNRQARESKANNDELQDTVSNLVVTVQAGEAKIDQLHGSNDRLERVISELAERAAASEEQAKKLRKYIENVDRETNGTKKKLIQLSNNDRIESEILKLRGYMKTLDGSNRNTNQKVDKLGGDNHDLHEAMTRLRNDHTILIKNVESKLVMASLARDGEVNKLCERVGKLEDKNSMLDRLLLQNTDENIEIRQSLSGLVNENDGLKQKAIITKQSMLQQEEKSDAHENKLLALEKELDTEFAARNNQHDALKANVDLFHDESTREIAKLAEEVSELELRVQNITEAAPEDRTAQPEVADMDIAAPLEILQGLCCNRDGTINDLEGSLVGRIIEGDITRTYRREYTCDANGRFCNSKGGLIAMAQTFTASH